MMSSTGKGRKAASGVVIVVILAIIVGAGLFSGYVFATMRNGSSSMTTGSSSVRGTTTVVPSSTTTGSSASATDSTRIATSSTYSGSSTSAVRTSSTSQGVASSSTTSTTSSSSGFVLPANGSEVIIPPGIQDADAKQQNITFEPYNLRVVVGVNNTVFWYDADLQDNLGHVLESTSWPSAAQPFAFDILPGQVANVTLTVPGTYIYNCEWHAVWMSGTITVVAG